MSEYVLSTGTMAVLEIPVGSDEWELLIDELYDYGGVSINYEGTIIYTQKDYYEVIGHLSLFDGDDYSGILEELDSYLSKSLKDRLKIDQTKPIKPYSCLWFNNADTPMSTITLDEFL